MMRSFVAATVLLVMAGGAGAAPLSKAQRRCVDRLNGAAADVAQAAALELLECFERAGRNRLGAGETVASCVAADASHQRRRANARAARADRACTTPPPFGPTRVADLLPAFERLVRPELLFGSDLDAAVVRDRARELACQLTVGRDAVAIAASKLRAFRSCVRKRLADGTWTSVADLLACEDPASNADVARRVASAQRRAGKRCSADRVAACFPGACRDAALGTLLACVDRAVDCGVCLAFNAGAEVGRDCRTASAGPAVAYCREATPPANGASVARQWDEELLDAIRHDTPRPTVHARNLFHTAVAMYDAWAVYDLTAAPYLAHERVPSADLAADRAAAISYAAYRVLRERFARSPGAATSLAAFDARMATLGYDPAITTTEGSSATAVGNRIGAAVLAYGLGDGANEADDYKDLTYQSVNRNPLIVKQPGTEMDDPNRWQPLALDFMITQNGIPLPDKVQTYIGSHWGGVKPFATTTANPASLPGPPLVGQAAFLDGIRRVLELQSQLTTADGATVSISPATRGDNPLGTNDGTGYATNPITGAPYAPNVLARGDFGRVMAEYWADGPRSETPPGHWNVIANYVADQPATLKRIAGGPVLEALEWDVKLYLALNGALHDAAIACWGLKRQYDGVRPISAIRYAAGKGQSTSAALPSFDPHGLPLVDGVIALITSATTAPGGPHEHLAGHENEIAVYAWPGEPDDPVNQVRGLTWIRAVEWVPYQRKTFVTPAFPGYVSGHSTFSRAAAEVLTRFTGSEYFPGGLGSFTAEAGTYLTFEDGPSVTVTMQWATYFDAADDAGLSRLFGGIHVPADDFGGRLTGAVVGPAAFEKASRYFAGTP